MDGLDLLGNEGREVISACVKVSVFRKQKLRKYTKTKALERLRGCYVHSSNIEDLILSVLPEKDKNGKPKDTFNIIDIYKTLNDLDKMDSVEIYPEESRLDSTKIKQEISNQRKGVDTEYEKSVPIGAEARSIADDGDGGKNHLNDNAAEEKEYDETDADHSSDKTEHRDEVETESSFEYSEKGTTTEQGCEEATSDDEIDHGSGFIVGDNLIITCKHVIDDVLCDNTKEVRIANEFIADLPCEVVLNDPSADLALLYCSDLKRHGICPLEVSEHSPLPGISIFTFGYPFTFNGKTALFLEGYVSGINYEQYGKPSLMVLSCPVAHGNSGGPVLHRAKGEVKVVGVIAKKHKKDILTIEDTDKIEKIRDSFESLKTSSNTDVNKDQISVNLLVMKLHSALETHCSFHLCNAVPGKLVTDFMAKYKT